MLNHWEEHIAEDQAKIEEADSITPDKTGNADSGWKLKTPRRIGTADSETNWNCTGTQGFWRQLTLDTIYLEKYDNAVSFNSVNRTTHNQSINRTNNQPSSLKRKEKQFSGKEYKSHKGK